MSKFYRLVIYIFLTILLFFSIFLLIFQKDIISYLNGISNLKYRDLVNTKPEDISNNNNFGKLNLDFINSDHFKNLKKAEVDLTNIVVPGDDEEGDEEEDDEGDGGTQLNFKVGNTNPFRSF